MGTWLQVLITNELNQEWQILLHLHFLPIQGLHLASRENIGGTATSLLDNALKLDQSHTIFVFKGSFVHDIF